MERQTSGFAPIHGALIYFEVAGTGPPFVMVHAGVADCRQWNNEFAAFQDSYRILRYDLRGYGNSEPVDGEFSHLADLIALLGYVGMSEPLVLMGCSMGGGLALDFALASPSQVKALVLVGAGPSGLKLDVSKHPKVDDAEKASSDGDLDLVAELETQIWFDGMGRPPYQVNPSMRHLVLEMCRRGLELDARHLGRRLPDSDRPAADRLSEVAAPVLVVVGQHDTPFIQAAANYMVDRLAVAKKVMMEDAAHLPNLDHPTAFRGLVASFLQAVQS
jgi:pimeloyl-ACP methyl ester carboxylesterase